MTLQEVLEAIENRETAVRLNVANDWRAFYRGILGSPEVRALDRFLALPATADAVLKRVRSLAEREIDPRYENMWDVALTIYVVMLMRRNPVVGRMALQVAQGARQCWWVYQAARRLPDGLMPRISSGSSSAPPPYPYDTTILRVSEGDIDADNNFIVLPTSPRVRSPAFAMARHKPSRRPVATPPNIASGRTRWIHPLSPPMTHQRRLEIDRSCMERALSIIHYRQ